MSDNPSVKHPLLVSIEDKLELVDTLWGGTASMRDAGTTYLPQEPGEESDNYTNRLARSVLYPAYKEAVKTNTGKLFIHDVVVSDPAVGVEEILVTVDEDENDVTEFATTLTEQAIHEGCAYILVDYPKMDEASTLADERAVGGRPYWVLIKQKQVLEASPVMVNGKRRLGVFRFIETVAHREGQFTIKYVEQIKQFTRFVDGIGFVAFRKDDNGTWYQYDDGILTGVEEIPIAAANVNPAGFMVGSPLFYDLAEENILNWQMRSDYNNIVHISQVPMLQSIGSDAKTDNNGNRVNPVVISANTVLDYSNPNAKGASWVEVSGKAAKVGAEALESSERRMASMSLELLSKIDSKSTATAAKIDAMESFSVLQNVGKTVEQAIEKAIGFTYKYINTENDNTVVTINIDDAVITGTVDEVNHLIKLFEAKILSKKTTMMEVQRRGIISDTINVDDELESIDPQVDEPNGEVGPPDSE